ncbi:MAG TPA: hypothetical protein VLG11_05235 [Candidatus Saccharimonadales bacterium]|nr:hypothetical protein [Candidatus Saccharimonadales bacterium]
MTFPENPLPQQPTEQNTERHREPAPRWVVKGAGAVAVGALMFTAGAVADHYGFSHDRPLGPSAASIEAGLNSDAHVVDDVTVEVGYELPFEHNGPDGAIALFNPIKMGDGLYAYISEIPQSGKVTVGTVHYDGPLVQTFEGGHSKAYPHEIVTPLAEVYNTYSMGGSPGGARTRYYSVIMGDLSGDTSQFNVVPSGVSPAEADGIIAQQQGEIAASRAGELAFNGK